MNINPDETRLALWLEDELQGEELAAFEATVANKPELHAAREDARRWRGLMAQTIPASEEPPYAEFFNHKVAQAIRGLHALPPVASKVERVISWRAWFMPMTACACIALGFWLGVKRMPGPPEIDVTGAPRAIPVEPILYTPENGVSAEWFASTAASATVIVLNGVQAIPDATDFSETVYLNRQREIDSTAAIESEPGSTQ